MTAEEYIKREWGENWLRTEWNSVDVISSLEEYASRKTQKLNIELSFALGQIDKLRELVKAQDELIKWFDEDQITGDAKLREKIEKFKSEL